MNKKETEDRKDRYSNKQKRQDIKEIDRRHNEHEENIKIGRRYCKMKELDIERGNKGGRMRRGHKRERE